MGHFSKYKGFQKYKNKGLGYFCATCKAMGCGLIYSDSVLKVVFNIVLSRFQINGLFSLFSLFFKF